MKYKVFVINPGSTSTKLALYENETQIACENVFHDSTILKQFQTINEQLPYRLEVIRSFIEERHLDLSGLDAIVGRGGSSYSVRSGVYAINEQMIRDTREQKGGLNHVSNLGIQLAAELQKIYGGQILTLNPTVVDELQDVARITGVKGVYRHAISHALSLKETGRRHGQAIGRPYEELNLILCHIDGGISITAHEKGRMIDGNNAGGGEGPFTPTRMGSMAVTDVLEHFSSMSHADLLMLCTESGGLSSHFGTSNADQIHALIDAGDPYARLVWEAMIYQIAKSIGAMSTVLCGQVDGIILTGGLLRFPEIEQEIRRRCGFIADVFVYPGEFELETMANAALSVLRGEKQPLEYTGKPVFSGFPFEP